MPEKITGTLEVTAATSGGDIADSYNLLVNGETHTIDVNKATSIELDGGIYHAEMIDIALNCKVSGDNPRNVIVEKSATTSITFNISCHLQNKIIFTSDRNNTYGIYKMNSDGSNPKALLISNGGGDFPVVSNDGTKIAYLGNANGFGLYTMDADGSNPQKIAGGLSRGYSWSPNDNRIAFGGNNEIYVINVDGTGLTQLTTNSAIDMEPSWSPDGNKIAFCSDRSGTYHIYIVNPDGTGLHQITNEGESNITPRYSPDGSKFVFMSTRENYSHEVHTMNNNGTNIQRITFGSGHFNNPSWSPNGNEIAVQSGMLSDNYEVYKISTDGSGTVTNLTNNSSYDARSFWSPTE